jgi:hypothetical protein
MFIDNGPADSGGTFEQIRPAHHEHNWINSDRPGFIDVSAQDCPHGSYCPDGDDCPEIPRAKRHSLRDVEFGERVRIWWHGSPLEVVREECGVRVVDVHGGDLRGHIIRPKLGRAMLVDG